MSRPAPSVSFDIVIVGGGMVGAALAAALKDAPLSVALIEGQAPTPLDNLPPDLRVSAISRASQQLLERVDVWSALVDRACPFRHMHVWDAGGTGSTHFDATEIGEPDLGHIVENRRIQHALWRQLEQQRNLRLLCPARLTHLSNTSAAAQLHLDDGTELMARLAVGADGGRSRVRELAGIATTGWGYGQKTIVGNVQTSRPHRNTAWQRFLPSGPVAFLPLYDGSCSIAWHTRSAEADRLMALDDDAFCAAYTRATGQALGRVESIGPRGCFPLHRRHAVNYHRGRMVLIGDAAHTVHPLAGQGANLGFLDAATLGRLLCEAAQDRQDIAAQKLLQTYEHRRRPHNASIMRAMDLFAGLFALESAPVRWARSLGMDVADHSGPLKSWVMRYAMGMNAPI